MAVQRRKDVSTLSDEAFAAWREQKMRDLLRSAPGKTRHGRRRHAQEVMRKYIKMRRTRLEGAEES